MTEIKPTQEPGFTVGTPFYRCGIGGMKVVGARPAAGATIALHGGPGADCRTLYPFFPDDKLRGVWYFADIPNHGRSDDTGGDWRPETCIARLDRFAQSLGAPLRVVGLSWGACVALEWAVARPGRFAGLVSLSGPGDFEAIVRHQNHALACMPDAVKATMAALADADAAQVPALSNRLWLETLPIWLRGNPGMERYREGTRHFASNPMVGQAYTTHWLAPRLRGDRTQQLLQQLHRQGTPAMLMRGLEDRMGDDACAMDTYAPGTPARVVHIPMAGHCMFVDQPTPFFAALDAFLHPSG